MTQRRGHRSLTAPDPIDTAKLRAIAEAATPGPWEWTEPDDLCRLTAPDGSEVLSAYAYSTMDADVGAEKEDDATHIATFDPPTVLALLDEIDRLRAPGGEHAFAHVPDIEKHALVVDHNVDEPDEWWIYCSCCGCDRPCRHGPYATDADAMAAWRDEHPITHAALKDRP